MDVENLSYFFTGILFGYIFRALGQIINVFEIWLLRFVNKK